MKRKAAKPDPVPSHPRPATAWRAPRLVALALSIAAPGGAAMANNVGENGTWQFQTTADRTNRAYLEDMRLKRQSGYYAAPVYTTNIDRQYNCTVTSQATGNQASSTAVGNSPTTSGNSANAMGNANTTGVDTGYNGTGGTVSGSQGNDGQVESSTSGSVSASVNGNAYQTLNTDQQNTGDQAASVNGSSACQFGLLN